MVHQAYELWFKQLIFELESVRDLMIDGEAERARHYLTRVHAIERADRAHPGARDDDAAGLPRVPLAAHAGVGVPVGAVPRGGVPERTEGAALPEAARRHTRGPRAARAAARGTHGVGRLRALLEANGLDMPEDDESVRMESLVRMAKDRKYAGLFAVSEAPARPRRGVRAAAPPRPHGRTRSAPSPEPVVRPGYLVRRSTSGSSPSSGGCGATSRSNQDAAGRAVGPVVPSRSPRSAARASASASRALRAHHPVDGGRAVEGGCAWNQDHASSPGTASRRRVELHRGAARRSRRRSEPSSAGRTPADPPAECGPAASAARRASR